MTALLVEVDGRIVHIDARQVVKIGRAIDSEIVVSGETVSRLHAELRPTEDGWNLVDVGSQHGTYVDGRQVSELRVITPMTVHLGLDDSGTTLVLKGNNAESWREQTTPIAKNDEEHTTEVEPEADTSAQARTGDYASRPSHHAAYAETVSVGEKPCPDLVVGVKGAQQRFAHPAEVAIGRVPECDVVIEDPACSRVHGHVQSSGKGWTYTNASNKGTFIRGRRISSLRLTEPTTIQLGHPDAGAEVVLTPVQSAAQAERRVRARERQRRARALGALAAVVLAAGSLSVFLLTRGDDEAPDRLTAEELEGAKMATVLISAESKTASGKPTAWSGSGSIISADGQILTNAHVAEPEADGLEERYGPSEDLNPEYLEISIIEDADDSPAAPAFRARVVRSTGDFDASLIQIYATIDGDDLPGKLGLPTMKLGDSDKLTSGDDVTVLGFPGISSSDRVSVTRGTISTFVDSSTLGKRSEIDTDARIAPGNSGGAAINNAAEIIGIPSSTFTLDGSPIESGRIIPINRVMPLLMGNR